MVQWQPYCVYLTTEETAQTIQELVIAIGENLSNKSDR